jgi:hypothetical protein
MRRRRLPRTAGPQTTRQRYNSYDRDPYDPLKKPASKTKPPLARDDASNVNPQPRPGQPPSPPRR